MRTNSQPSTWTELASGALDPLLTALELFFLPDRDGLFQRVDDKAAQDKFSKAWQADLSPDEGLNLNVMMKELAKGTLKGLFVMGEDILISEPNAQVVEKAVENCEFLVCQEIWQLHHRKLPSQMELV